MVLLKVNKSTHEDIEQRITRLGPIYTADFFINSMEHGLIINLGEVGLVIDPKDLKERKNADKS